METRTPEDLLDDHFVAFANQDLEAIMTNYGDDSVFVSNFGVFHGLEEIKERYTEYLDEFSQEETTIELENAIFEGDFAYILWHGETPDNIYEFCTDTYYIPEETINVQTFAAKVKRKD